MEVAAGINDDAAGYRQPAGGESFRATICAAADGPACADGQAVSTIAATAPTARDAPSTL